MKKIVISGGPHSGKTSLIGALEEKYPAFEYLPEPATVVVSEAQKNDGLYWRDIFDSSLEFCTLCMNQSVHAESLVDPVSKFVFLDRSLIDTIGYARRDGCEELVPELKELARLALYDVVFFCEPVGEIKGRIEDADIAKHTHELLEQAYREINIALISLPAVGIDERVRIVETVLAIN
jgi:predicted ATPase